MKNLKTFKSKLVLNTTYFKSEQFCLGLLSYDKFTSFLYIKLGLQNGKIRTSKRTLVAIPLGRTKLFTSNLRTKSLVF